MNETIFPSSESKTTSSFPTTGSMYCWPRGFFLSTPTFVLNRGEHPTRRPSIRIMLCARDHFDIELSDGTWLTSQAVLMSAKVKRRQIIAINCDFALFDFAVSTSEYAALAPLLTEHDVVQLPVNRLSSILPEFAIGRAHALKESEVLELRQRLVYTITGKRCSPPDYDPRVESALQIIHQLPLEEVKLNGLAKAVHLSPDRFRHLFKQNVGCTYSHYARTSAVWKALMHWSKGKRLTEIAHEVGFHDYSHFNHAFQEMFGFNPSVVTEMQNFEFIFLIENVIRE